MNIEERYAVHPEDFKMYDTKKIRNEFLIKTIFESNNINLVYSDYDRFIVGGVCPVGKEIKLETFENLKSQYFLERRELGIINVGGKGKVVADGITYELNNKDALYLGKETKEVSFLSDSTTAPAKFYINSAPAHQKYPSKLVSFTDADKMVLGSAENANNRQINRLIIASIFPTCQLQMGLTQLKIGSVWNTMPAHTHKRRMEAYFYFELPENQAVCHFMGQPFETRHIWMRNEQAVLSPNWSIHSGVGTSSYSFVWGMAGENLDYGDMDAAGNIL